MGAFEGLAEVVVEGAAILCCVAFLDLCAVLLVGVLL
jgi:hypothetical protein